MTRTLSTPSAILLIFGLAACAAPPKVALQQEAKQSIKRIAIIEILEPEQYLMNPGLASPGFLLHPFDVIGAVVFSTVSFSIIELNRHYKASKNFTLAVSPFMPNIKSTFQSQIETGLKAKGYHIRRVPAPPKSGDGKDYDLAKVEGDFDAFLIGTLFGGYSVEAGGVSPRLVARVRLVHKSGDPIYFSQGYKYSVRKRGDFIHLAPESRFTLASPEAVYKNGQLAAEALRVGASRIADQVVLEF